LIKEIACQLESFFLPIKAASTLLMNEVQVWLDLPASAHPKIKNLMFKKKFRNNILDGY